MSNAILMATLRRLVSKANGRILPDGSGGWEIIAPPNHRWIDERVDCLVLAMNEYHLPGEAAAEIQRCIDIVTSGIERFPGE